MKSLKEFKLSDESLKKILGGGDDCNKTTATTVTQTYSRACTDTHTVTNNDCGEWISSCYVEICD